MNIKEYFQYCNINKISISEANYFLINFTIKKERFIYIKVVGDSMFPTLKNNSIVEIDTSPRKAKFGDIVLARYEKRFIIHRFLGKKRIKGDNNIQFDLNCFEIVGYIPFKKNIYLFLGSFISLVEGVINYKIKTEGLTKIKYLFFLKSIE